MTPGELAAYIDGYHLKRQEQAWWTGWLVNLQRSRKKPYSLAELLGDEDAEHETADISAEEAERRRQELLDLPPIVPGTERATIEEIMRG